VKYRQSWLRQADTRELPIREAQEQRRDTSPYFPGIISLNLDLLNRAVSLYI